MKDWGGSLDNRNCGNVEKTENRSYLILVSDILSFYESKTA